MNYILTDKKLHDQEQPVINNYIHTVNVALHIYLTIYLYILYICLPNMVK